MIDRQRQDLGAKAACMFRAAALQIRDSIGHPLDALHESWPYEEMAGAWDAWAAGAERWASFCRKHRKLARRLAESKDRP